MVGQRHRDKEKTQVSSLHETIKSLQEENEELFELCTRTIMQRNCASIEKLRSMLKTQVQYLNGVPVTHRISDVTAAKLGVCYLSGAMALLLLEIIACRRNLIVKKIGRLRSNDLVCPKRSVFESIIANGINQLRRDAELLPISETLRIISDIHSNWSKFEAVNDVLNSRDLAVLFNSNNRDRHVKLLGISKSNLRKSHRHNLICINNYTALEDNDDSYDIDDMDVDLDVVNVR